MSNTEPFLKITGKGLNVFYKGRFLYSSIDPNGRTEKRLKNIDIDEGTLIFIPSIGLGYGLDILIKKLPQNAHILCIEADEQLFKLAFGEKNINIPNSEKLTIVRTTNLDAVKNIIHRLKLEHIRRVRKIIISGGYYLYRNIYDSMERVLNNEIASYWQNRITIIGMGKLWMHNILVNLEQLHKTMNINSLKINVPIFILGAGPTAQNAIDDIIALRDKSVIIAVDSSLPLLCKLKTEPDFIVTVDSQNINLMDFLSCRFKNSSIISDLSVNPDIFRLKEKKCHFTFISQFQQLSIFKRMKKMALLPFTLPPLGSVGNTSLYIASMISRKPVITIGLDFCYPKHKTHASGTAFYDTILFNNYRFNTLESQNYKAIYDRPLIDLKTSNGKIIKTDIVLNNYANRFLELAENSERIYVYKGIQPTDKIPFLKNRNELSRLFENTINSNSNNTKRLEIMPVNFPYENLKKFIIQELEILKKAEKAVNSILLQNNNTQNTVLHDERLDNVDYTYFFFPDYKGFIPRSSSFLERVLFSIRSTMTLLKRVK